MIFHLSFGSAITGLLCHSGPICKYNLRMEEKMSDLARFGVSLEKGLLDVFDARIKEQSYETRSKAIADLIKEYISAEVVEGNGTVAGAISFLYDHHNKDMVSKLLEIQHDVHDAVLSMQHIHMDHNNCLEILAVRGKADDIGRLYHQIKALKGVKMASISVVGIDM